MDCFIINIVKRLFSIEEPSGATWRSLRKGGFWEGVLVKNLHILHDSVTRPLCIRAFYNLVQCNLNFSVFFSFELQCRILHRRVIWSKSLFLWQVVCTVLLYDVVHCTVQVVWCHFFIGEYNSTKMIQTSLEKEQRLRCSILCRSKCLIWSGRKKVGKPNTETSHLQKERKFHIRGGSFWCLCHFAIDIGLLAEKYFFSSLFVNTCKYFLFSFCLEQQQVRQACSSHHQTVVSICFWFSICQIW